MIFLTICISLIRLVMFWFIAQMSSTRQSGNVLKQKIFSQESCIRLKPLPYKTMCVNNPWTNLMFYVTEKKGTFCISVIGVSCWSRPLAWNRNRVALVRKFNSLFIRISNNPFFVREACGGMEQKSPAVTVV